MKVDPTLQALIDQIENLNRGGRTLPPTPPDATLGGMDPWQTSVETRLGQLNDSLGRLEDRVDSNFKWLLGAYGAGVVLILGALGSGFVYLADKIH